MQLSNKNITIIGVGNLGLAITNGLLKSGLLANNRLRLRTNRKSGG